MQEHLNIYRSLLESSADIEKPESREKKLALFIALESSISGIPPNLDVWLSTEKSINIFLEKWQTGLNERDFFSLMALKSQSTNNQMLSWKLFLPTLLSPKTRLGAYLDSRSKENFIVSEMREWLLRAHFLVPSDRSLWGSRYRIQWTASVLFSMTLNFISLTTIGIPVHIPRLLFTDFLSRNIARFRNTIIASLITLEWSSAWTRKIIPIILVSLATSVSISQFKNLQAAQESFEIPEVQNLTTKDELIQKARLLLSQNENAFQTDLASHHELKRMTIKQLQDLIQSLESSHTP